MLVHLHKIKIDVGLPHDFFIFFIETELLTKKEGYEKILATPLVFVYFGIKRSGI